MIAIQQVSEQKKQYLPLLLLGDEQESMIDRYLEQGTLYVMQKAGNPIAVCVILRASETEWEVKNLAVAVSEQGKGYGRKFLQFLEQQLAGTAEWLILGTGDSPKTIPFYQKCGFVPYRRIPHFFSEHYDHPIIEGGVLLDDMYDEAYCNVQISGRGKRKDGNGKCSGCKGKGRTAAGTDSAAEEVGSTAEQSVRRPDQL